jgi:dTDP-4-dehydrorhamnose 3,5-epimerase
LQRVETSLPGVVLLDPKVNSDPRGFFLESYHHRHFEELGIGDNFVQDNHSKSSKNTLRGLHYQLQHAQSKLCRVVRGEVLDVAVDIRFGSPHFGKWTSATLSEENKRQIYIPAGFAHGFMVLSETAEFLYKCSDYYHPEDEFGVIWSDPWIGIDWKISSPLLSRKDEALPPLEAIPPERLPKYAASANSHGIRARVLSLGKHSPVLRARNLVLEQAGYEVTAATAVEGALQALAAQPFDAVIIGYTFSKAEKKELASRIEKEFKIPVLLLYIKPGDLEIPATAHTSAIHGENALLASLAALVARG